MRFITQLKKINPLYIFLGAALSLTSCGSYQYVGYDNDGIYGSEGQVVVEVERAAPYNSDYYQNYFAEEAQALEEISAESDIFTDIDSYQGTGEVVAETEVNYAGWGQVNDQVIINVYDNGWNNWAWGWNDPWLWNGGFGWGWNNWGWNRWGWNRWNNWGWNSWAWGGWGWNSPWYYGYGWNNWGWGGWNSWGHSYYGNNSLAYNYGRRGATYGRSSLLNSRSVSDLGRTSSAITRRNATATSSSLSRRTALNSINRPSRLSQGASSTRNRYGISSNTRTGVRSNSGNSTRISRPGTRYGSPTRTVRPGSNSSSTRSRISRPSTTRSSGSRSGSIGRSSSSSRSSGSVRSSSSSSRSSGSVRSSSGGGSRGSSGSGSSGRGGRG